MRNLHLRDASLFGRTESQISSILPDQKGILGLTRGQNLKPNRWIEVYRRGNARLLWSSLSETTTTAGMVLFIIAAASPFAQTLATAGVSAEIGGMLSGLGGSTLLFMIISIIVLIIMGQLLEGLPAILIFAPLLLPIAVGLGINPVQYSMVLVVGMGIGSFAPPAGVGFYVASATGRETVEKSLRHFYPYLAVLIAGAILIALVPWFSTVLPQLFGLPIN